MTKWHVPDMFLICHHGWQHVLKKTDTRLSYQTYKMISKHVLFCMTSQKAEWHYSCQTYMTDVTTETQISDKMAFLAKKGRWITVWLFCMSALPLHEAEGRFIQRWNKTIKLFFDLFQGGTWISRQSASYSFLSRTFEPQTRMRT